MSWEALGRNPVEGDVDAVLRVASAFGSIGDQAEVISRRLRVVGDGTGTEVWRGDAADAFRRRLGEIGPEIERLTGSHRAAEDAVRAFAVALTGAQDNARQAEAKAAAGIADRALAARNRGTAETEEATQAATAQAYRRRVQEARIKQLTALGSGDQVWHAQLVGYERQMAAQQQHAESTAAQARARKQAAANAESQAQARVDAAKVLAAQATELRDLGAREVVQRLDAAGRPALPDGNPITAGWERLKDGVRDLGNAARVAVSSPTFLTWLDGISKAGDVLTIVGIGVACIPGLQLLGGGLILLGRAASLASLIGTVAAAGYGKQGLGDVAWAAVGLIPGLKAAKGLVKPSMSLAPALRGLALEEASIIRRALRYSGPRNTPFLRGDPVAPQLRGFERKVVHALPIKPTLYYRTRLILDHAPLREAFDFGKARITSLGDPGSRPVTPPRPATPAPPTRPLQENTR